MSSSEGPSYEVEFAASGKSKCRKCNTQIEKDSIRILNKTFQESEGYYIKHYFHAKCYTLPKQLSSGANRISASEFVESYLEDISDGKILPKRAKEIVSYIEKNTAAGGGRKSKGGKNDDTTTNNSVIAQIKEEYKKKYVDSDETSPPPKKKVKKGADDGDDAFVVSEKPIDTKSMSAKEIFNYQVELYKKYYKLKSDVIKDILGYNRQVKTGTKDFLLMKLIDGLTYGRLARCSVCDGGRLKLVEDDCRTVSCNGTFDESLQTRIPCSFTCTTDTAPRSFPWFTEEPTEEEKEALDREEAEARGEEFAGSGKPGSNDKVIDQYIDLSKTIIKQWNLTNRDGLRKAAEDIITVLSSNDTKISKQVDVPTEGKQAMQKVGQIISQNRSLSASEIIPLAITAFGYKEDKQNRDTKKQSGIALAVKCAANVPLVTAFQELSQLYFKTGNRNAGSTYSKVVKALSDLSFPITISNAKGLGSGKTKVQNIGKASVDKIIEFCETGTMEKLEEKRADAA